MLGVLYTEKECKEIGYLLRKELELLLQELKEHQLDEIMREIIKERYRIIFRMYARIASPNQLARYAISNTKLV